MSGPITQTCLVFPTVTRAPGLQSPRFLWPQNYIHSCNDSGHEGGVGAGASFHLRSLCCAGPGAPAGLPLPGRTAVLLIAGGTGITTLVESGTAAFSWTGFWVMTLSVFLEPLRVVFMQVPLLAMLSLKANLLVVAAQYPAQRAIYIVFWGVGGGMDGILTTSASVRPKIL